MEEMAGTYIGPHRIILNKNIENHGLGAHINTAIDRANGKIIIMAAGDDISLPNRVKKLHHYYSEDENVSAVFSNAVFIEDNGTPTQSDQKSYDDKDLSLIEISRHGGGIGMGASYSFRKTVFEWPQKYPCHINCEDKLLPLRASLLGKIKFCKEPLIKYRLSETGISRIITPKNSYISRPEHIGEQISTIKAGLRQKKIKREYAALSNRLISNRRRYYRLKDKANKIRTPLS